MNHANILICVGRQFGSGGREIAKLLAQKLNIAYYDKELIALAAQKSGLSLQVAQEADEKASNPFLYGSSCAAGTRVRQYMNIPINDQLYLAQCDVVKDIFSKNSAVVVGRCADSVLPNDPHVVSLFVHASMPARLARVQQRHNLSEAQAKKLIAKTDKQRKDYYNYYTGRQWAQLHNYDFAIKSESFAIETCADTLVGLITAHFKSKA